MKTKHDLHRRDFIKFAVVAGVGLVVSCGHYREGAADTGATGAGNKSEPFMPNAWIRIGYDNTITIMSHHSEMGQGVMTGLAMIVAEELEADWNLVKSEHAAAKPVYVNPDFGVQATGGSTSIKTSWDILRQAGASTRELMKIAAAKTWEVDPKECVAENSAIRHKENGKVLKYSDLIDKASKITPPEDVPLKKPEEFKIIGKSLPRLDSEAKTEGKAVFGFDFQAPEVLNAIVLRSPTIGGKLKSMDSTQAKKVKGVRDVTEISSGVAIVADHFYQALNASKEMKMEWLPGPHANLSNEKIFVKWKELAKKGGDRLREEGSIDNALSNADKTLEAEYFLPFQAHACPEPMNCTVRLEKDRLDIWVPTQNQGGVQEIGSIMTGLDPDQVFVHTTYLGGGFGRRCGVDYVKEAIELAKKIKKPVKVIWTREDDIRNDWYRPASYHVVKGALDKNKEPVALYHLIVCPSQMDTIIEDFAPAMMPGWMPRPLKNLGAKIAVPVAKYFMSAKAAAGGALDTAYEFDNLCIEYVKDDPGIPVMAWRSVGDSRNAFVMESFIDEMSVASSTDPLDFRLKLLKKADKRRRVLELVAEKAKWGAKQSGNIYKGLSVHDFHGTPAAMVAEVSVDKKGQVKVHKITAAVDCGIVINPKAVKTQIAGGIIFGLTATLKSEITIKDGKCEQSNFNDFPILTMEETPEIETHIVQSAAPPMGIGEIGVPPVAAAVTNAIFAATGKRIRKLPVDQTDFKE